VARIHRPFSYLYPDSAFPKEVEVQDLKGELVYKLASQPMLDQIPIDGVQTGPRTYRWHPVQPATLVWVEALDDGNPKKQVAYRDQVMMLAAPFKSAPTELIKTEQRFINLSWFENRNAALVTEYDRDKRWAHTVMVTPGKNEPPKEIWSRNVQDRYRDPGAPLARLLLNGHRAIQQHGDWIYLIGAGASPEGERPFLDRLNLETLKSERLFRSDTKQYESFVALVNDDGTQFVTRHESPTEAPNYFLRTTATAGPAVPI